MSVPGVGPKWECLPATKKIERKFRASFIQKKWIFNTVSEKQTTIKKINLHLNDILHAIDHKGTLNKVQVLTTLHKLYKEVDGILFQIENQHCMGYDFLYRSLAFLGKEIPAKLPEGNSFSLDPLENGLLEADDNLYNIADYVNRAKKQLFLEWIPLSADLVEIIMEYQPVLKI